jgi:hypothetical protein
MLATEEKSRQFILIMERACDKSSVIVKQQSALTHEGYLRMRILE